MTAQHWQQAKLGCGWPDFPLGPGVPQSSISRNLLLWLILVHAIPLFREASWLKDMFFKPQLWITKYHNSTCKMSARIKHSCKIAEATLTICYCLQAAFFATPIHFLQRMRGIFHECSETWSDPWWFVSCEMGTLCQSRAGPRPFILPHEYMIRKLVLDVLRGSTANAAFNFVFEITVSVELTSLLWGDGVAFLSLSLSPCGYGETVYKMIDCGEPWVMGVET